MPCGINVHFIETLRVLYSIYFFNYRFKMNSALEYMTKYGGVRIWSEGIAFSLEELVLELDPMETKSMQEALQQVHYHQHSECHTPECRPEYNTKHNCHWNSLGLEYSLENKSHKSLSKLTVC